jgi:hypothetical protein
MMCLLLKFTKVKEFVKGKSIVLFFGSSMTLREWVLRVLKGIKVVFSLVIESITHSSKPYQLLLDYTIWKTTRPREMTIGCFNKFSK